MHIITYNICYILWCILYYTYTGQKKHFWQELNDMVKVKLRFYCTNNAFTGLCHITYIKFVA